MKAALRGRDMGTDTHVGANDEAYADAAGDEEAVTLTAAVGESPYGRTSGALHRTLETLELFAVERRPLTVGAVAERLRYPQSSTSLLLQRMTDWGYLSHDRRQRTYVPTPRVALLGMWMQERTFNEADLLDTLDTLARDSGHVAILGMQNGAQLQYIHIVAARSSRVGLKPGLLRPLCRAALGKVLLSACSDDEVRRTVRYANATDRSGLPPVDVDRLLAELTECRRTGLAQSIDEVTPGSSTFAVLVPGWNGGASMALGVAVHTREVEEARPFVVDLLQAAAKRLSRGVLRAPPVNPSPSWLEAQVYAVPDPLGDMDLDI